MAKFKIYGWTFETDGWDMIMLVQLRNDLLLALEAVDEQISELGETG